MREGTKEAFIRLGIEISEFLSGVQSGNEFHVKLEKKMPEAFHKNNWFTGENVRHAMHGISFMLERDKMNKWLDMYGEGESNSRPKKVGIVMAGNVPLVGFHDLLCVLISGNTVMVKLSSDDQVLMPVLLERLFELDDSIMERVVTVDKLSGFDAVIATGSNNSSRYFEYYFRNVPHIIRKNRTSLAVLSGDEDFDQLKELGKDVFQYFGLGCRNVSKLYIPEDFDLDRFFGAILDYQDIVKHHKYGNNYDYYKAYYLMNKEEMIENGFLILKEDKSLHSPVAMLFYERYKNLSDVMEAIKIQGESIQCAVSISDKIENAVPFGHSQSPELWDYADGVDTMEFLLGL